MRPTVPAAGDEVLASWASDLIDFIGAGWRYVPIARVASSVQNASGLSGVQTAELTMLPANDPKVVAAAIELMVRTSDTATVTTSVLNWDGTAAGMAYSTGVASRGGQGGVLKPTVGGVNNRQIKWQPGSAAAATYIWVVGYWVRDSVEPLAFAGEPAVIDGDGADPIALVSERSGIVGNIGIENGQGGIPSSGTGYFLVA
jgi:hypothetical protein